MVNLNQKKDKIPDEFKKIAKEFESDMIVDGANIDELGD